MCGFFGVSPPCAEAPWLVERSADHGRDIWIILYAKVLARQYEEILGYWGYFQYHILSTVWFLVEQIQTVAIDCQKGRYNMVWRCSMFVSICSVVTNNPSKGKSIETSMQLHCLLPLPILGFMHVFYKSIPVFWKHIHSPEPPNSMCCFFVCFVSLTPKQCVFFCSSHVLLVMEETLHYSLCTTPL